MILQALAFYLFAFVAIAAAVMVISARNPVHSVLFLILAAGVVAVPLATLATAALAMLSGLAASARALRVRPLETLR